MSATPDQRDGRTVRAERTRQALVDSLLSLLDEGRLTPTAAAIAARAGVSERSSSSTSPCPARRCSRPSRASSTTGSMPTLEPVDSTLPLPERIEQFTAQRARLYEQIGGVRRAGLLVEHESSSVAGWPRPPGQGLRRRAGVQRELDAIRLTSRTRCRPR